MKNFIKQQLEKSKPLNYVNEEIKLVEMIIDSAHKLKFTDKNLLLAAGFDLLVSADYYGSIAHKNWVYCPTPSNKPIGI